MKPRHLCAALLLCLLSTAATAAGTGDPIGSVSHIASRLRYSGVSMLAAHLHRMPPSALTVPLTEGNGSVVKGYMPEYEASLAQYLLALDMRHEVLRVALGSYLNERFALIKIEATVRATNSFDVQALQEDAVAALNAAFALAQDMAVVDVWAVVPCDENPEYGHIPVFSVTAQRDSFLAAVSEPRTAPQVLSRLGVIRLAPEYSLFAAVPSAGKLGLLPNSRYELPPASANWPGLVLECERRLAASEPAPVGLFEGLRSSARCAALTIDDGPHPLTTPLMLAVLKHHGVRATFFLVGQKAEEYPELVRMIDRDGHEIGNHAYTNTRATTLSGPQILAEVTACQNVVAQLTGTQVRFFRPPGGRLTRDGLQAVSVSGLALAMWTNNANDWLRPAPEVIAGNVLRGLEPGGVILMHQGSMESFLALPLIIEGARTRGLRLCSMAEMHDNGAARIRQDEPEGLFALLGKMGYHHD